MSKVLNVLITKAIVSGLTCNSCVNTIDKSIVKRELTTDNVQIENGLGFGLICAYILGTMCISVNVIFKYNESARNKCVKSYQQEVISMRKLHDEHCLQITFEKTDFRPTTVNGSLVWERFF